MYEMYINGTIAPYNEQAEPGVTRQSCVFRAWSRVPSEDGIIEKILRRRETRLLCSPSLLLLYKRRIFRARERVGRRYAAAAYRRINQNYYEAISAAATGRIKRRPPPSMINHFSRSIVSRWIIIIIGRFSIVEREGISAFENIKLDER